MGIQIDPGATHHDPPIRDYRGDCADCAGDGKKCGRCGEPYPSECCCNGFAEPFDCDECDGMGETPEDS